MYVCVWVSLCVYVYLWILDCKPLYLCLGASISHVYISSSIICSSTSVCICMYVSPPACLWGHVFVHLHKSVCMRMNFSGWLSGWMHLCVHVQMFMLLCTCEYSICMGILYACVYVYASVPVLVCACLCGMHAHLCLHAYIWLYIQVSVQVYVCEVVLGSASVGACQHAQVNRHACFYVYLCASVLVQVYVNGYLCLYTHVECLYMYKPVCVCAYICTSFYVHSSSV